MKVSKPPNTRILPSDEWSNNGQILKMNLTKISKKFAKFLGLKLFIGNTKAHNYCDMSNFGPLPLPCHSLVKETISQGNFCKSAIPSWKCQIETLPWFIPVMVKMFTFADITSYGQQHAYYWLVYCSVTCWVVCPTIVYQKQRLVSQTNC